MFINFCRNIQNKDVIFVFYDKYANLCKEKGISPSKAAEEIGINKASVTNWKKRGYTPRAEILHRIADYFGVTVDYLLGKVDLPFLSKDDKGLLDIDEYALTETKKPVPTDGDGLDEQDRQLVELMKLLTADQKEFLRAQLLTLTGQGK